MIKKLLKETKHTNYNVEVNDLGNIVIIDTQEKEKIDWDKIYKESVSKR